MHPTLEGIPSRGIKHIITRGLTNGDSNQARKSYVWMMESLAIREDQTTREASSLNFRLGELARVIFLHSDALVIRATIVNYEVVWVLVNSGSSVNVLSQEAFNYMQLEEAQIEEVAMAL